MEFFPATPDRWDDLVELFGAKGACGGCWCMHWRVPAAVFERFKGEGHKAALKAVIDGGEVPGLLAYVDGRPVGWVAVAPRAAYVRLEKSRTLKPLDDQPVWSVVCFFVAKAHRRQGVSVALLKAACRWAAEHGATVVEGYPTEPGQDLPDPFVYTGIASAFLAAGFQEAARPARTRAIMRWYA